MRIIRILALLLGLMPMQLIAQQHTVSLDTILKRIDENNPMLQTYALRAESYKHRAEAGSAWMAPMVGAGTFMTPYPGQEVMDGDKGSLMLQLEQEIPNPSKLRAQKVYEASKADVEFAGRAIASNTLKARAKNLYYTWIIAGQRIKVLRENEKIMQMMQKIEEIRYPYNQSQLSGVYRSRAKIEENENMIRMQQGEIAKAKAWLNSLMNLPATQPLAIDSSTLPAFTPEARLDTVLLAGQRKDILQMEQNIRSMQLGVKAMKNQSKPDFKLRVDHMSPLGSMMPKQYSVMGMVSIPLAPWSSKMYKSEVKAMNYEIQAMEKERVGMLQESHGMLTGMQYEIQSMQKRIAAMEEKIIPSLRKTMEADFVNYQENKLEVVAVINSWEALTMMQLNVLDEKMKLYQMIVDYEKELYR
ncbi:TolC family protein [Pedobacter sp. SAFR-022]|uniref:TolC family protein n=1 Tax=Pedobacter sp. SAFR-022 TaxID=3436861 RepID=UPI003F7E02DC